MYVCNLTVAKVGMAIKFQLAISQKTIWNLELKKNSWEFFHQNLKERVTWEPLSNLVWNDPNIFF